jgi:hypothetical protein
VLVCHGIIPQNVARFLGTATCISFLTLILIDTFFQFLPSPLGVATHSLGTAGIELSEVGNNRDRRLETCSP